MLQKAIENEVGEFVAAHASLRTLGTHQAVVRMVRCRPGRSLRALGLWMYGNRGFETAEPERILFNSGILPRYLRRVPSVDALIPALTCGDFHRGFHRGPGGHSGNQCHGIVGGQHRSAQGRMGSGV